MLLPIQYVCSFIDKCVVRDSFEDGEVGDHRSKSAEEVLIVADTLPELMVKIAKEIKVPAIDNLQPVWRGSDRKMPDVNSPHIQLVSYERTETRRGTVPTADETAQWQKGEYTLYTAKYTFKIMRRLKQPLVSHDELHAAFPFYEE